MYIVVTLNNIIESIETFDNLEKAIKYYDDQSHKGLLVYVYDIVDGNPVLIMQSEDAEKRV